MAWWKKAGDFLNVEKASEFLDKAKAVAQNAADAAKNLSDTVQEEYRRTFEDLDCKIVYVRPQLAAMEFPSNDTISRLAMRLGNAHGEKARIYNLSDMQYDYSKFQGEIIDVASAGLPLPCLEKLVDMCLAAHQWLEAGTDNVVVVHCTDFWRSCVVLSCMLVFRGLHSNPGDALTEVCGLLELNQVEITPSLKRYLSYFQQCLQSVSTTLAKIRLAAVKLNAVPCYDDKGSVAFRPVVEVLSHGQVAYSSPVSQELLAIDSGVTLHLPEEAIVWGDTSVRVYHADATGKRILALSFTLYASFLTQDLRLAKAELDVACSDPRFPAGCSLELVVQLLGAGDVVEAPAVFERARIASRDFQEEQRRRQEAAKVQPLLDEGEELEKTLMHGSSSSGSVATGSAGSAANTSKSADGAVDLQKALAEAAAEDSPSGAVAPGTSAGSPSTSAAIQGNSASGGYAAAVATASPAAGGYAASTSASAAASQPEALKKSNDEIDELFSQFDAALDGLGGATSTSTGETSKPTDSTATTAAPAKLSDESDPFADTDAFLKELDS